MKSTFTKNLKTLSKQYSQKDIASKTNVSPASITNYINGVNEPTLSFLIALKTAFNIDLDNFLFGNYEAPVLTLENTSLEHSRFVGNYIFYYYDTSPYKGSANIYTKNALNYGIVSVSAKTNENKHPVVYAQFLLNRKEAEATLEKLNNSTQSEILDEYSKLNDFYEGTLSPNANHIFINLKNKNKNDECFMILNNPPSNKSYIGGIATVNSISRGREHMPCIQYSIMSRYNLNITDGEIYNMLTLNTPDINVDLDVENLIKLFKNLYINSSENSLSLNEYQKKRIIEESLKNTLEELLESNVFKFAKISDMEDDRYYRIIKEEMFNV